MNVHSPRDYHYMQWAPAVYDFLSEAVPGDPPITSKTWQMNLEKYPCLGYARNGQPVLGALLHYHVKPYRAELTIRATSPRYVHKTHLTVLFNWIFGKMQVKRLESQVAVNNERSLKTTFALGFKQEGIARLGWDENTDAVVSSMLKEDCRFIGDL